MGPDGMHPRVLRDLLLLLYENCLVFLMFYSQYSVCSRTSTEREKPLPET